jgi:hypothetical protein
MPQQPDTDFLTTCLYMRRAAFNVVAGHEVRCVCQALLLCQQLRCQRFQDALRVCVNTMLAAGRASLQGLLLLLLQQSGYSGSQGFMHTSKLGKEGLCMSSGNGQSLDRPPWTPC